MEVNKFYTNQNDLAETLKEIIDRYIAKEISNQKMVDTVYELIKLNEDKYFSNMGEREIAPRVKGKLGVKRLSIISKVFEMKGELIWVQ